MRGAVLLAALLAGAGRSVGAADAAPATAPSCSAQPLDGRSPAAGFVPADHLGEVLYVDFWASWCPPCARAFPFMNALHADLAPRGLRVVAINLDEDPEDAARFLERHPAAFGLLADATGACPRAWGVTAMPSTFLVDRTGRIRHVHRGFRAGDGPGLRAQIEALLAE